MGLFLRLGVGGVSENGNANRSFWTSVPGILTGLAGVLAAAATLIGVLVAIGQGDGQENIANTLPTVSTGGGQTGGGQTGGGGGQTGGGQTGGGGGQTGGGQTGGGQTGGGGGQTGGGQTGGGGGQTGGGQTGGGGGQTGGGQTGQGGGNGSGTAAKLMGEWQNVDPTTRSTTRYVISGSGDSVNVAGYGSCTPIECNWAQSVGGPRTVSTSDANTGQFTIAWPFGFKTQTDLIELLPDGRVKVTSTHDYTDDRADRQETQFFAKISS